MAVKTSQKPGYEIAKRRMKARSRAFHRLAALHRPDFLRLLGEEQRALDAEHAAAQAAAQPPRLTARAATGLDDPALRYAGCPVSAPRGWIHDREESR